MTKLKNLWQQPPQCFKHRLKIDNIAPDGVLFDVPWDMFVPGTSMFIPCINTVECGKQVNGVATIYDWTVDVRVAIEGGRWGVRVWRVL
jgi:hypothetical protein